MKQFARELRIQTRGKGLYDFTREVEGWVAGLHLTTGLLTLFIQHTSASLTIQENADPDVIRDLNEFFGRLVKENESWYRHTAEGPDDMTSHIRAALTQTQISVPLFEGTLALGTWQVIYVFEHRATPHARSVILHMLGE
ncbi:MAG: secondary thiamine-phosphate synthase enzyme YjbQ [Acidobacteriota bacterium]|nr:secondary thiamine-phosphate synthase enzyme YjbQ [Acidobacteriota bacterium]